MSLETSRAHRSIVSTARGESLGRPTERGIRELHKPQSGENLPFVPQEPSTTNMDPISVSLLARRRQSPEAQPIFHRTVPQNKR